MPMGHRAGSPQNRGRIREVGLAARAEDSRGVTTPKVCKSNILIVKDLLLRERLPDNGRPSGSHPVTGHGGNREG